MFRYVLLAVLVTVASSSPRRKDSYDQRSQLISNVIRNAPRNANLLRFDYVTPTDISSMLISNYTTIREEITDGFSCEGRIYGYYADTANECQVFHICVPLNQLYPETFKANEIFHFSFICPKYTRFTQDAMVCAWEREAVPCEYAEELYNLNENFGKKEEDEADSEAETVGNTAEVPPEGAIVTVSEDGSISFVRKTKKP